MDGASTRAFKQSRSWPCTRLNAANFHPYCLVSQKMFPLFSGQPRHRNSLFLKTSLHQKEKKRVRERERESSTIPIRAMDAESAS